MTLRFASLFSGCGGLDYGFIKAGFRCVAAFDNDKDAVASYKRNIGDHIHQYDLSSVDRAIIDRVAGVDVLIAGPPCQGFSTAGKNLLNDARNSLLLMVAEVAAITRPKAVVIENVRGLLGSKYAAYWAALITRLESSGYRVSYRLIEATDYGVAQSRRRVIVVGIRASEPLDLDFPNRAKRTLRDVLMNLDDVPQHDVREITPGSDLHRIAKRIKPGQKLSNVRGGRHSVHTWQIPDVFGATTEREKLLLETLLIARRRNRRREDGDADPVAVKHLEETLGFPVISLLKDLQKKGYVRKVGKYFDLTNAFNGKFRRLEWDKPAPTVDTRFGQPRYFLHPDKNRGFTVRESARIQGFPDSFCFEGPAQVAYRLIGNAVPPPMAESIAMHIREALCRDDECILIS